MSENQKSSYFGGHGNVNIKVFESSLKHFIPEKHYRSSDLYKVTEGMSSVFSKLPLKPKETFSIILTSKVMPDKEELSREETINVLARAFKYIILRRR